MSIQDRLAHLLAEETPSAIGVPAEQFLKHLKAAESAADKMVARITTARAAAEKNAKKIVAKMKQGT